MNNKVLALTICAGSILSVEGASAQTVVLCDNCNDPTQFEAAAEIHHGNMRGYGSYLVVNDNTGESAFVETSYTPPGEVPMAIPARASAGRPVSMPDAALDIRAGKVRAKVMHPALVVPPGKKSNIEASKSASGGDNVTTTREPSPGERMQILDITKMAKNVVFVHPDPTDGPFGSFSEGRSSMRAVEGVLTTALAANNPAWHADYISPNLIKSLFNAIETARGKGPRGCILFGNGDVACWSLNVMAPGAARLLEGTAKDAEGNDIASEGAPNPGGTRIGVRPNTPNAGQTTYVIGSLT